jgi:coenzyme Q-binding protein COQ10
VPSFRTQRRVPYSPKEMFDVVADVERYPEFLPLCESLVVESCNPTAEGSVLVARMAVGYRAIREAFTTRVTMTHAEPAILVEYLDGPFSHLENRWRFLPASGGCEVDFYIDYQFRSTILALVMGAVFDKAVRHYTDAFEARARAIYPAPAVSPHA